MSIIKTKRLRALADCLKHILFGTSMDFTVEEFRRPVFPVHIQVGCIACALMLIKLLRVSLHLEGNIVLEVI